MGTYSTDRQPGVNELLVEPARRLAGRAYVVAGPGYPVDLRWPANVERIDHLPPREHRAFYNRQRYTLNITRADMVAAGYSPSVRLFEAAACGTPIISDYWSGLEDFFTLGEEILVARCAEDVVRYLDEIPDSHRIEIGARAKARVLAQHTAAVRAAELETTVRELTGSGQPAAAPI
jgi:spore maturation protein CgeB